MIPWKQRLIAFLLRRFLGPFLDDASNQQLHDSIDVSFNDGSIALTNVGLNADHLNTILSSNPSCCRLSIVRASVERLVITFRLQENSPSASSATTSSAASAISSTFGTAATAVAAQSSIAWRAMKLGTFENDSPTVSLIAEVDIYGVSIELEPSFSTPPPPVEAPGPTPGADDSPEAPAQASQAKSMISSYVDAALASLQLTLQMKDVRIRIVTPSKPSQSEVMRAGRKQWMEFRMSSLKYQDMKGQREYDASGKSTRLQYKKTLSFGDVSLRSGEAADIDVDADGDAHVGAGVDGGSPSSQVAQVAASQESILFQASGNGQVFVRLFGAQESKSTEAEAEPNTQATAEQQQQQQQQTTQLPGPAKAKPLQQDVEISLNQRVTASVDQISLARVHSIVSQVLGSDRIDADGENSDGGLPPMSSHTTATLRQLRDGSDNDDDDLEALNVILKQYKEAYHLAENNQLRGGILVPSNAYEGDGVVEGDESSHDDGTFDVFFDANEGSAYNYASILKESIMEAAGAASASASVPSPASTSPSKSDSIHTKVRLHLLAGSLKINFIDPRYGPAFRRPMEYMLAEFGDLHIQSSIGPASMISQVTVSHFQIEDAQLDTSSPNVVESTSAAGLHFLEGRLKISNIFRFSRMCQSLGNVTGADPMGDADGLISEAPCVSVSLTKRLKGNDTSHLHCDVQMAPMEMAYRDRTVSNLSTLVRKLTQGNGTESAPDTNATATATASSTSSSSFACSCDSITMKIPVGPIDDYGPMFNRSYETFQGDVNGEASIGCLVDGLRVSYGLDSNGSGISGKVSSTGNGVEDIPGEQVVLSSSCHHIIAFAEVPDQGKGFSAKNRTRRVDFCIARGRLEVNPYIPIELSVRLNCTKAQGKESLPMVPAISSFKTRQADDDEEDVDRLLLSPISGGMDGHSRYEFKTSSPQPLLIANAERCGTVILLNVPDVAAEISVGEFSCLHKMLQTIQTDDGEVSRQQQQQDTTKNQTKTTPSASEVGQGTAITFVVDRLSLSLCGHSGDATSPSARSDGAVHTHSFVIDRLCLHSVIGDEGMQHGRILCHDLALYEVLGVVSTKRHHDMTMAERVHALRQRCLCGSRGNLSTPIVYRSQLFTAISHESPSISIDVISNSASSRSQMRQLSVHCSIYHMTHRLDVDSQWCAHLMESLSKITSATTATASTTASPTQETAGGSHPSKTNSNQHGAERSLTRLFVTFVDCNLDYVAPSYVAAPSRLILRIGDLRVSGNMTKPSGKLQTLSVSLGDLDAHICNRQQSYEVENSRLCRASEMIHPDNSRIGFVSMSPPDTLLREMDFIHIVSLDSMDAIVALALKPDQLPAKTANTTVSITLGLLSIHACRDSFNCFTTTIGDLQAKLSSLPEHEMDRLVNELPSDTCVTTRTSTDTPALQSRIADGDKGSSSDALEGSDRTKKQGSIQSSSDDAAMSIEDKLNRRNHPDFSSFLLDGYDWTTIDHNPLPEVAIPQGREEVGMWYSKSAVEHSNKRPHIPSYLLGAAKIGTSSILNPQHFPMHKLSDPLSEGDMDAPRFAATNYVPSVKNRVLIHKLDFKMRLFDGYDWPNEIDEDIRSLAKKSNFFVIEGELEKQALARKAAVENEDEDKDVDLGGPSDTVEESKVESTSMLMNDLLGDTADVPSVFEDTPLPEERMRRIMKESELLYFSRKTHRFFQIALNEVQVRLDGYTERPDHHLASVLELSAKDLFVMETVSSVQPIKMAGEWVNDKEHPRDSTTGALMLKMITWNPEHRITPERQLVGDECELSIELLPMRCLIDQSAINFARAFFADDGSDSDDGIDVNGKWQLQLNLVPAPHFISFRVKPWKLKVDYYPKKLNIDALRDGSIVELVNLSPIDAMVIRLNEVRVEDVIGFGSTFGGAVSQWIGDICATQLHKFLTSARPFEPLSNVVGGISDLVVLPYEAYSNGESVGRAMAAGVTLLAETVAFETLSTTSRLTKFAASQMAKALEENNPHMASAASNPLPSRPLATPKGMSDVTGHAFESLARGLKAANYKVVVVPYREMSRHGTSGAVKSVIRGIPVLIVAPLTGATEAISYTLLGARNALRPDIRKEEEATRTGLSCNVQH